jgi:hypothetical protein
VPADGAATPAPSSSTDGRRESTQNFTIPSLPNLTIPGRGANPMPRLVATGRPLPVPPPAPVVVSAETPPPAAAETPPPLAEEIDGPVVLDSIRSVVTLGTLTGGGREEPEIDPQAFVRYVMAAAAAGGQLPLMPGDVGRLADGTWTCQFPSTVPAAVVPLKLTAALSRWGLDPEQPDANTLMLRRVAGGGGLFGGKKYGYEVTIRFPAGGATAGEVTVLGRLFGNQDHKLAREAPDVMPKLLADIRAELGNVADRRKQPRVAYDRTVTLYQIHSDGRVGQAVQARCRDVSSGGLGFAAPKLHTKYVYAAFDGATGTRGHAILMRLMWMQRGAEEYAYGAQFRSDL